MQFSVARDSFRSNAAAVGRLLEFDRAIIEIAMDGLRQVATRLEEKHLHTLVQIANGRATLLENIKDSDSLRPQYEAMFNQCVVLLVSYFGSALHRLFRDGVAVALNTSALVPAAGEELKMSWRMVAEGEDAKERLFADMLIAQHDISFQDMQSVARAFKKHLEIDVARSVDTNNIILGQAARHVIAHTGAMIDEKMIRQVANATPRTIKQTLKVATHIRFSPEEVRILAASMDSYLAELVELLEVAVATWNGSSST